MDLNDRNSNRVQAQPAEPLSRFQRQQVAPGTARRRNQPLQCMAADFVCCPAAAGGAGSACRTNFGGGLGEREAERSLPQPASAVPIINPQEILADSKNSGTPIYGSRIRDRMRGSKRNRALPGGTGASSVLTECSRRASDTRPVLPWAGCSTGRSSRRRESAG